MCRLGPAAHMILENIENLDDVEDVEDVKDVKDVEDGGDVGDVENVKYVKGVEVVRDGEDVNDMENVDHVNDSNLETFLSILFGTSTVTWRGMAMHFSLPRTLQTFLGICLVTWEAFDS